MEVAAELGGLPARPRLCPAHFDQEFHIPFWTVGLRTRLKLPKRTKKNQFFLYQEMYLSCFKRIVRGLPSRDGLYFLRELEPPGGQTLSILHFQDSRRMLYPGKKSELGAGGPECQPSSVSIQLRVFSEHPPLCEPPVLGAGLLRHLSPLSAVRWLRRAPSSCRALSSAFCVCCLSPRNPSRPLPACLPRTHPHTPVICGLFSRKCSFSDSIPL